MTKTFEIEAKGILTKAQVNKLTDLLERIVYYTHTDIDLDLLRLETVIKSMNNDLNGVYLKHSRGGNHIWISTVKDNERIAMISYLQPEISEYRIIFRDLDSNRMDSAKCDVENREQAELFFNECVKGDRNLKLVTITKTSPHYEY